MLTADAWLAQMNDQSVGGHHRLEFDRVLAPVAIVEPTLMLAGATYRAYRAVDKTDAMFQRRAFAMHGCGICLHVRNRPMSGLANQLRYARTTKARALAPEQARPW